MPKDYKPPPEAADTYARYKAHYEGERALKPEMLEAADHDLKAGATVGQLAAWTGLTPEVFRRRARILGVERKRPPTVGRLTAAPAQADSRPADATPRRQVTHALPKPVPSISPKVRALPSDRIAELADKARERQPEWVEGIQREYPTLRGPDLDDLIVDLGHQKGFKIPELDEPADRPVTCEETAEFAARARSKADGMQSKKLDQVAETAAAGYEDSAVMHAALDMELLTHDEVYGERPAGSEETSG